MKRQLSSARHEENLATLPAELVLCIARHIFSEWHDRKQWFDWYLLGMALKLSHVCRSLRLLYQSVYESDNLRELRALFTTSLNSCYPSFGLYAGDTYPYPGPSMLFSFASLRPEYAALLWSILSPEQSNELEHCLETLHYRENNVIKVHYSEIKYLRYRVERVAHHSRELVPTQRFELLARFMDLVWYSDRNQGRITVRPAYAIKTRLCDTYVYKGSLIGFLDASVSEPRHNEIPWCYARVEDSAVAVDLRLMQRLPSQELTGDIIGRLYCVKHLHEMPTAQDEADTEARLGASRRWCLAVNQCVESLDLLDQAGLLADSVSSSDEEDDNDGAKT
jgi:hypothetical protein